MKKSPVVPPGVRETAQTQDQEAVWFWHDGSVSDDRSRYLPGTRRPLNIPNALRANEALALACQGLELEELPPLIRRARVYAGRYPHALGPELARRMFWWAGQKNTPTREYSHKGLDSSSTIE
ncbi:MAG: hypothetical protein M0P73_16335 [Syntrophobacterales bacterium]|nr:hypothetical protein [Syntrophobacterales bacterium]